MTEHWYYVRYFYCCCLPCGSLGQMRAYIIRVKFCISRCDCSLQPNSYWFEHINMVALTMQSYVAWCMEDVGWVGSHSGNYIVADRYLWQFFVKWIWCVCYSSTHHHSFYFLVRKSLNKSIRPNREMLLLLPLYCYNTIVAQNI